MEWYQLGGILVGALLLLLTTSLPVAFSMGVLGVVTLLLMRGLTPTLSLIGLAAYSVPANFVLICVPLFIFMAEVIIFAGIGDEAFEAMSKWLGTLPGGLAISCIMACAIFGAVSGVSIAACVAIGSEAIPQMLKRGYNKSLATGSVAAAGALAILIPPSVVMVLYAVVAEESVGRLFMGGFIPGFILAALMSALVIVRVMLRPELAPSVEPSTWREKILAVRGVASVAVLALLVLGVIYSGIATPTEAAALGAGGAVLITIKKLNWPRLRKAMLNTAQATSFIFTIMVCASLFAFALTSLQIPQQLSSFITSTSTNRWIIMILIQILLIILGTFLDVASIVLVTCPILVPLVVALGFDKVWFGVMFVINMEMAVITPPVAFNLYVVHGISKQYGVTFEQVAKGALPFMIVEVMLLGMCMIWPELIMWLPTTMKG